MSKDKKPTPPVPIRKDELHKAAEREPPRPEPVQDNRRPVHPPPHDKPKKWG